MEIDSDTVTNTSGSVQQDHHAILSRPLSLHATRDQALEDVDTKASVTPRDAINVRVRNKNLIPRTLVKARIKIITAKKTGNWSNINEEVLKNDVRYMIERVGRFSFPTTMMNGPRIPQHEERSAWLYHHVNTWSTEILDALPSSNSVIADILINSSELFRNVCYTHAYYNEDSPLYLWKSFTRNPASASVPAPASTSSTVLRQHRVNTMYGSHLRRGDRFIDSKDGEDKAEAEEVVKSLERMSVSVTVDQGADVEMWYVQLVEVKRG